VEKLQFVITNENGNTYTFAKSVSALVRGTIYDLGSFPTSCVTPKISMDEDGAVVMTTSPAEAKIYYTTDGSDPSAEATLYEGPVEITADTQFKAIAICEGLGNSAVAEYTAASGVTAPVLKINESGFLTVEAADGHTYTYSMTSDGSIPGDPVTALPEEGLNLCITGSHNIKIKATNMKGETAVTNGYYRVYYLATQLPGGSKIEIAAGNSSDACSPFTIINTHETQSISLTRGDQGKYWKLSSTNFSSIYQSNLEIGIMTEYASKLSLNIYERAAKAVYQFYDGVRQTDDLSDVTAPTDNKTIATKWTPIFDKCSITESNKRVHFRMANGSEIKGFGLLEQGFESFNPAAASVSNEAPVPGQNVAY
jgi:hypothetical protein